MIREERKNMDTDKALELAESLMKDFAISTNRPEENRVDFVIDRKNLKPAIKAILLDKRWGYLSAITGLDNALWKVDETTNEKVIDPSGGNLELLYHFCQAAAVATLRVSIPYDDPKVDSICDLISSVSLYEREAAELFGIEFVGAPNTDKLLLPDNWPAGVYPLRKTFTSLEDSAKG
jgi:Ni,Fe-hydrogenase III component G